MSALRARHLWLAVALCASACGVMRTFSGAKVTGTCAGACAHYLDCKPGATAADRQRCNAECPEVFSDSDSLRAFESLSCSATVSYVDGDPPTTADTAPAP
jgi:hypothetical protein